jgi:hypothetical protein
MDVWFEPAKETVTGFGNSVERESESVYIVKGFDIHSGHKPSPNFLNSVRYGSPDSDLMNKALERVGYSTDYFAENHSKDGPAKFGV